MTVNEMTSPNGVKSTKMIGTVVWRSALKRFGLMFVMVLCACSEDDKNPVVDMPDMVVGDMSDMTKDASKEHGSCQSDMDCGSKGYCHPKLSLCFRTTPSISITCTDAMNLFDGKGCQMIYYDTTGVLHDGECQMDEECLDSVFGQNCIAGLCSTFDKCPPSQMNAMCADGYQCSAIGACLPSL